MKRLFMLAAIAAATIFSAGSEAHAQIGGGLFYGGGFGQTTIWDLYRSGQIPVPPYFALNPPVYYSYPVPRTYGYSPWPYPGNTRTPDLIAPPEPLEIINPYFNSSDTQPAPEPEETVQTPPTQSTPLVINNPFASERSAIYQVAH